MTWAYKQGTGVQSSSGSVTSQTVTFAGAVTVNDLICVGVGSYLGGTLSCTDLTNNLPYNQAAYVNSSSNQSAIFWLQTPLGATAGTFTVKVSCTTPAGLVVAIDEFDPGGAANVVFVDNTNSKTYSSTATPSLASALTVSGTDLIYATVEALLSSGTYTAGTGCTETYSHLWVSGICVGLASEYALNITSSFNPSFTLSSAVGNTEVGVAFKTLAGLGQGGALNTARFAGPFPGAILFTVSPGSILASNPSTVTLTLTGSGTSWTSGSVVTIQNSVTGTTTVTAGTWTQSSSTSATLGVTTGPGVGTFTITVDSVASPAISTHAPTITYLPWLFGDQCNEMQG